MTAKPEIQPYCQTCGKFIPEPGMAYGINPDALCRCCKHDRIAAHAPEQAKQEPSVPLNTLRDLWNQKRTAKDFCNAVYGLIYPEDQTEKEGTLPLVYAHPKLTADDAPWYSNEQEPSVPLNKLKAAFDDIAPLLRIRDLIHIAENEAEC